jgi:hypothetical protein
MVFELVEEGQLDGFAPESKERLLFPRLLANRHAGVAAKGAELHEFPATPPQPVDASVAQDFLAMGALMRHARLGMAGAKHRTVR